MQQAPFGIIRNLSLFLLLIEPGSNAALARSDNPVIDRIGAQAAQSEGAEAAQLIPAFEMCSASTMHQDRVSVKPVARPPFLKAFKEPGFGTRTTRITDSASGEVNKPAGKPAQAWNSDETLLLLHRYDDVHEPVLYDGNSYRQIGVLDVPVSDSEDLYWSRNDPQLIYFVAQTGPLQGNLLEYNVSSEQASSLIDFTPLCGQAGLSVEDGRLARPSGDDDLFAFRCGMSADASLALSYRRSTDTVSSKPTGRGTAWPVNALPQPMISGRYLWLAGEVLDDTLAATDASLDMSDPLQELTIGQNHERQDALYQSPLSISPGGCDDDGWRGLGLVVEHRVPEGDCRSVIDQSDGYPQMPDPDVFASAHERPHWLAMSNIGYGDFDAFLSGQQAPLLFSEILIMNSTPGAGQVCRLAHHRSFARSAANGDYAPHLGEPNVTQSPSGTRVLFSTDWYDSGFVDTYVIELQPYTPYDLAGRWVDTDNQRVTTEFSQAGEKFSFERISYSPEHDGSIRTLGSGSISSARLDIDYAILLDDDREINGECTGEIQDRDRLSLECSDHYFGRQDVSLQRR